MGHGVGVPALRQHGHRDDAADIPSRRDALVDPAIAASRAHRRVRRIVLVIGRLLVVLADQIRPLLRHLAAGPGLLADGVEDEAQAPGLVLGAAGLHVLHDPGVDADRDLLSRPACETRVARRRPPYRRRANRKPPGHPGIPADHDEHRRHRMQLPLPAASCQSRKPAVPILGQLVDGRRGVGHDQLGGQLGAITILLGPVLDPAPDIEIARLLRPGDVPGRQLGHLDQPGLDGIQEPEVGHDPGQGLAHLVTRALDEKGRGRQIHAQPDTLLAPAHQLVDAIQGLDPDRRLPGVLLRQPAPGPRPRSRPASGSPPGIPAPIGVMGLIVEDQPMRTAAAPRAQLLRGCASARRDPIRNNGSRWFHWPCRRCGSPASPRRCVPPAPHRR